jgi:hypothetical protein
MNAKRMESCFWLSLEHTCYLFRQTELFTGSFSGGQSGKSQQGSDRVAALVHEEHQH